MYKYSIECWDNEENEVAKFQGLVAGKSYIDAMDALLKWYTDEWIDIYSVKLEELDNPLNEDDISDILDSFE